MYKLYRLYDENGILLYVGVCQNVQARLLMHKHSKPWFRNVVDIEIESYENKNAALLAETKAIVNERPQFNTQKVPKNSSSAGHWIKKIREARGETQAEFGAHFGVHQSTVHRWEIYNVGKTGVTRLGIERVLSDLNSARSLGPTPRAG
jgi:DNA-binding transcriptional regulator YiaG